MEYNFLQVNIDMLKGLIPEALIEFSGSKAPVALFASTDGIAAGVIVLGDGYVGRSEVNISYMAVDPYFRGIGLAEDMLRYLFDILSSAGCQRINAYVSEFLCPVGEEHVMEILSAAGFNKTDRHARMLRYSVSGIKESRLYQERDSVKQLYEKVKGVEELPEGALEQFEKTVVESGRFFDSSLLDPLLARFYVEKKEIVGYMDFRELQNSNSIFLFDSFIKKGCESVYPRPAMLVSFMEIATEIEEDETDIFLPVYSDSEYNGVHSAFGDPIKALSIKIFRKVL